MRSLFDLCKKFIIDVNELFSSLSFTIIEIDLSPTPLIADSPNLIDFLFSLFSSILNLLLEKLISGFSKSILSLSSSFLSKIILSVLSIE